jgi:hypothetical protein
LWFLPAIYPKKELTVKENAEYMKEQNFSAWKEVYQREYGVPLEYAKK